MDFEYEINKWWFSNGDKLIEYADAIVFLLFLIAVLYIFIFSLASLKRQGTNILLPGRNTALSFYFLPTRKMQSLLILFVHFWNRITLPICMRLS